MRRRKRRGYVEGDFGNGEKQQADSADEETIKGDRVYDWQNVQVQMKSIPQSLGQFKHNLWKQRVIGWINC